jgi:hypothetical protein
LGEAGDQNIVAEPTYRSDNSRNFRDLLTFPHNDLGEALPQNAVVINVGKSEVFKREVA